MEIKKEEVLQSETIKMILVYKNRHYVTTRKFTDLYLDTFTDKVNGFIREAKNGSAFLMREAYEDQDLPMQTGINPPNLMQFFEFEHLPPFLQAVSAPYSALANLIVGTLEPGAETTVALRKLLESKDCAVRAKLSEKGG